MRYFTPLLFLAVSGYVGWYNTAHDDRVILLPMLDRIFPMLEGDMASQGRLTVIMFFVVGLALLTWNLYFDIKERQAARTDEPPTA